MSDVAKAIAENTSHFVVPGMGLVDIRESSSLRWIDMIMPKQKEEPKEDNRSCKEIAEDMWARIRG